MLLDVTSTQKVDPVDQAPPIDPVAVSRQGDLWLARGHRLLCGDALNELDYERLLGEDLADIVFEDPPYNVRISGNVSGLGKHRHREFTQASGDLSKKKFTDFLTASLKLAARFSKDGSIHYICMDHRHIQEITAAGEIAYDELKNLCVWDKQTGGMGSLYRAQHELVFVYKKGTARHINNIELGRHGRNRTNVWSYPGLSGFGRGRDAALELHPTVKPVALVADALRDCSKRGGLVLDAFGGSGTTMMAAERTGRRAALIEIDPLYVDTAIRRWEALTGQAVVLAGDGRTFAEIQATRQADDPATTSDKGASR
jgi:DNA modification methylase